MIQQRQSSPGYYSEMWRQRRTRTPRPRAARRIDPPTTAVHIQRRLQAWITLKRRPERMNNYSTIILMRMSQMGW